MKLLILKLILLYNFTYIIKNDGATKDYKIDINYFLTGVEDRETLSKILLQSLRGEISIGETKNKKFFENSEVAGAEDYFDHDDHLLSSSVSRGDSGNSAKSSQDSQNHVHISVSNRSRSESLSSGGSADAISGSKRTLVEETSKKTVLAVDESSEEGDRAGRKRSKHQVSIFTLS